MCNRYERGSIDKVRNLFSARVLRRINEGPLVIHPKSPGLVVRQVDGEMIVEQMLWGFPRHHKSKVTGQPLMPSPVNNARFDKLDSFFWRSTATKPAQRCLIPTARYAEAVGEAGSMTETWLSVRDQPIFAWAGLWRDSDEWGPVYTGVMTDNAPELADIHDRSPVILDPQDWQTWLSAPIDELYQFDRPYPAGKMSIERTDELWGRG